MRKPTAVGVGADQGLGAVAVAKAGHHVLVAGRTAAKLDAVVATIVAAGGSADPVSTDVTSEPDILRLFDRALSPSDSRRPADLEVDLRPFKEPF
jgi:NAD(P)-dependent dehydrogenase (short-subunit alcohol dehydrogenase family)